MIKALPDKDPLYIGFLRWCWGRPIYIGVPIALLGIFPITARDFLYLIYWWLTNWGREE